MATLTEITWFLVQFFVRYFQAFYRVFVPRKRKDVRGKVVLVTGAGRGIGKSVAEKFAELGTKIIILDINETEAQNTADEISSRGGAAAAYKCDVSKYDDVKKTAERIRNDVGHPDIVVSNAAFVVMKEVLATTEQEVERTMAVNVMAQFWMAKEFLPHMLKQNSGHIVTIASMSGKIGTPYTSAYGASKFACVGYTESLAEEIRLVHNKHGVLTSTVLPMIVDTHTVKQLSQEYTLDSGVPIMTPEFVAERVVDGVLRNEREIYVPSQGGSSNIFRALVPRRVRELIIDFSGAGVHKKTKSD